MLPRGCRNLFKQSLLAVTNIKHTVYMDEQNIKIVVLFLSESLREKYFYKTHLKQCQRETLQKLLRKHEPWCCQPINIPHVTALMTITNGTSLSVLSVSCYYRLDEEHQGRDQARHRWSEWEEESTLKHHLFVCSFNCSLNNCAVSARVSGRKTLFWNKPTERCHSSWSRRWILEAPRRTSLLSALPKTQGKVYKDLIWVLKSAV